MRRIVLCAAVLAAVIGFLGGIGPSYAAAEYVLQVVGADGAVSRSVTWQDAEGRSDYRFIYRKRKDAQEIQVPVTEQPRPPRYNADWQQAPYTYSAAMHDLEPETVYEFRIGSAAEMKEWQSFKTGKKKENTYKVIVMGDSQSVDYDVWGKTVQAAATNSNDAVFWIGMGDLTDNGQAWFQWRAWLEGGRPLAHLPFAPVLGNHEAYSLDWSFAPPEIYTALFPVPENGPKGQRKLAYSFDYGDVHYVSLNTDYEELREQNPTMLTDGAAWLDADLEEAVKRKQRLIILMHRSPWSTPYSGQVDTIGAAFLPVFDKYRVPLVLTAHEHCYARSVLLRAGAADKSGTVYITTGRSGSEGWRDARKRSFDAVYYNPLDMPVYIELEVRPDAYRIRACKVDGTVIDDAIVQTRRD